MKHLTVDLHKNNEWWKYALTIIIALIGAQTIGVIPLVVLLFIYGVKNPDAIGQISDISDIAALGVDSNLIMAFMLIPFIFTLLLLFVMIKSFHKRHYMSVFSGNSTIRWKRFFTGGLIWLILVATDLAISYFSHPEDFRIIFNLQSFVILFLVSIILIPIQASSEEILFRGYLAQGVAAKTRNRFLVILIPSLLFGLMHSFNPEIEEYGFWIMIPQYIIPGIMFGLISVLDDGIEISMGAHSANNVFLSLFVTSKASAFQTDAVLFQEKVDPVMSLISLIIFSLIFIFIISKIYKFDFNILTKKIKDESTLTETV